MQQQQTMSMEIMVEIHQCRTTLDLQQEYTAIQFVCFRIYEMNDEEYTLYLLNLMDCYFWLSM